MSNKKETYIVEWKENGELMSEIYYEGEYQKAFELKKQQESYGYITTLSFIQGGEIRDVNYRAIIEARKIIKWVEELTDGFDADQVEDFNEYILTKLNLVAYHVHTEKYDNL